MFVNVFGITACDAVDQRHRRRTGEASAPPTNRWSCAWTATKVDEGRKILASANHPLVTLAGPWTPAPTKAAELASKSKERAGQSIFRQRQQGHRQGITGGEGTKHTALMLKAGTNIVGGVQRTQWQAPPNQPRRRRRQRRNRWSSAGRQGH